MKKSCRQGGNFVLVTAATWIFFNLRCLILFSFCVHLVSNQCVSRSAVSLRRCRKLAQNITKDCMKIHYCNITLLLL